MDGVAALDEPGRPAQQSARARILVVDDDALMRRKLMMAARALGHDAEPAPSGAHAVERLEAGGIDLALLDIVMPGSDGYDVLEQRRLLPQPLQVPVIVISSLEEPDDIARAIALGAADFLPKNFNATILRARIDACLAAARRRAEEQQTLHDLARITAAAEALDSDELNPRELEIDDLAGRHGALGVLSRVLLNKSIVVYNRRQAQAQQIETLVGILLLLLVGACFGIKPALAALSLAALGDPFGVGLLTIGLTAMIILCYAALSGGGGKWPSARQLPMVMLLALLAPLLPQVLLFWVAGALDSVTLAILMSLEAMFVFFITAALGVERPALRRFVGLGIGLLGVSMILGPALSLGVSGGWLLLACCMPASLALRTVLLGTVGIRGVDPVPLAASIYLAASGALLTIALVTGRLSSLPAHVAESGYALAAFAVAEAIAAIALIELVRRSGSVFAGQKSFTTGLGGVMWSIILLGATITLATGGALVLLLAGLLLVAKRPAMANLYQRPPLLAASP